MPSSLESYFQSHPFLNLLTDSLIDAVYLLDPISSNVLWVNKAGYQDLGMEKSEVLNHSVLSLQKNVVGKAQWQSIADVIRAHKQYSFIGSHVRKDGSEFPVEVNTSVIKDDGNEYFLSIARDISERRAMEAKTSGREQQLITAINASTDGLWDWDIKTDYVFMSESWKKMLGYGSKELNNHVDTWKNSVHPDDIPHVFQALDEHLTGKRDRYQAEYRLRNRNGHYLWVKDIGSISSYDENGEPSRVTGLVTDITDYKQLEEKLLKLAAYDDLTNLRNRRECTRIFDKQLELATRNNSELGMALFDLDFFKSVNDKYGHLAGDKVLKEISETLIGNLRNADYLFRWGGEEFLLLCPNTNKHEMFNLAEKLRIIIAQVTTDYHGHAIQITASFGIATFPEHGKSQQELLLAADSALYTAKSKGRNSISLSGQSASAT